MKKYYVIIAVIIGLVATAIILLQTENVHVGYELEESDSQDSRILSRAPGPLGNQSELLFDGSVKKEDLIKNYKEWSKYPPDSRPLLPEHRDVIRHREIPVALQTMPVMQDGKPQDSGYQCLLQPATHSVTEGEKMQLFLACTGKGSITPLPIKLVEIKTVGRAGVKKFSPEEILGPFDDGTNGDPNAGDGIHTFSFSPKKQDWGDIHVTINFAVLDGNRSTELSLSTHFFSSPVAPARFTGRFNETYRDGSLFISAELEVMKPGNYTIEANLFGDEQPIAYAREDAKLDPGLQFVELEFFGKVLHDREIDGPFELKDLRGYLNTDVIQPEILAQSPAEVERFLKNVREDRPKRMLIPYSAASHETRKYAASEFPDDPYDSPEKRERLRQLSSLP